MALTTTAREIETTLAVRTHRPEEIIREIAAVSSVGTLTLHPRRTITIHDTYVDTEDGQLRKNGISLRMRSVGASRLITLKADATANHGGGISRFEMEEERTSATVAAAIEELRKRGIALSHAVGPVDDLLTRAGLQIIQERKTLRQRRDITGVARHTLAEMAVDFVQYLFPKRRVCFYEIEIETKAEDGQGAMQLVSGTLNERYAPHLSPWAHSKLATGFAIERLLARNPAWIHIGPNELLAPEAFDEIDSFLIQRTS